MRPWLRLTSIWAKLRRVGPARFAPVSLGSFNLALASLYFGPVYGREAVRALLSTHRGLGERTQAVAVVPFGHWLNLGLDELTATSGLLAGFKLVIAFAVFAYLIDFARALSVRRAVDRPTTDVVLLLATAAIVVWVVPPLVLADPALTRVCAAQLLLIAGAVVVIVIERQIEQSKQAGVAACDPLIPAVVRA